MLTNNAGFNCTTSRVIVTAAGWPQREALLDRIRRRLGALPDAPRLLPGRRGAVRAPSARSTPRRSCSATRRDGHLPWMLIPGLSPDAAGDPCYRVEAFCSVTAETPIDAPDAATFLERATAFANERCGGRSTRRSSWTRGRRGTRRSGPPSSGRSRTCATARSSLNHWSAAGYGIGITPWGAFPGNPRHDIGSGTGFVHNPLMFERGREDRHPRPVPRVAQAALVLEPPARPTS